MAGNDSSLAERQKETWRSRGENTTREGWSCCSKLWLSYQADGCRPGPGWGGLKWLERKAARRQPGRPRSQGPLLPAALRCLWAPLLGGKPA